MITYAVVFIDDQLDGMVLWNEYVGADFEIVKMFVDADKFYKVELWKDGQLIDEFYRNHH